MTKMMMTWTKGIPNVFKGRKGWIALLGCFSMSFHWLRVLTTLCFHYRENKWHFIRWEKNSPIVTLHSPCFTCVRMVINFKFSNDTLLAMGASSVHSFSLMIGYWTEYYLPYCKTLLPRSFSASVSLCLLLENTLTLYKNQNSMMNGDFL